MDEDGFLNQVLLGRRDAVLVCRMLGNISQTWDDLIDGDAVTAERVHNAFTDALLRLPALPFWQEHYAELQPLIRQAVIDWHTANTFEREASQSDKPNEHELMLGFVLRDSLIALTTHCAYLVGGHEHAISVAPEIRRYFHDESIQEYIGGLQ
ncbi:hypothetical protein [Algiphilus aromaticivorans]|uniref:hypothetical protein n=1 Tax=Algiphilus aromaticivorans TaxID=382454 RepID=UPI0005C16191|nr:hypothetical protein [Algiphilus aromaticivorans]